MNRFENSNVVIWATPEEYQLIIQAMNLLHWSAMSSDDAKAEQIKATLDKLLTFEKDMGNGYKQIIKI